jgi:homoisocitrate dehydrogenase
MNTMTERLCVIEGDGIGPEVVEVAVDCLQRIMPDLTVETAQAGWGTFQETGESVPLATLNALKRCGAGLFGAVQSPTRKVEGYRSAILTMRQGLNLYANLRPVRSIANLSQGSDVNLLVIRENSEGLYVGRERAIEDGFIAEKQVTRTASRRIAEAAQNAMLQAGMNQLTIAHKANVLPLTDGLFRDTVRSVFSESPEISVEELLIDVAALKMLAEPQRFQAIVTTNLYGDILSDAAAHWCGGLGLAPSLNLGDGVALAEPVHGSAPDIVGTGKANPAAAILSLALLARHHWQRSVIAERLENAVHRAFLRGGSELAAAGTAAVARAVQENL